MTNNRCAIYARYSSIDALTGEGLSRSITNQVKILSEYASEKGLEVYKVYTDYHVSGKNFDRPQIQELLKDADTGAFSTILVKDLSRFGRNYIEVGDFVDNVFPEKGLRFIAVNDNFDSFEYNDYLSIAVKNFMNAYYIKDIARKIRKTMALRAEKEPIMSTCYGYLIKNKKIEIYEPEAKIVRRIYKEYKNGSTTFEIRTRLKKEKIPKPKASRLLKSGKVDEFEKLSEERKYEWDKETIVRILTNPFYKGSARNFVSDKVKSSIKRNIIIENSRWAIIDAELWESIDRKGLEVRNMEVRERHLKRFIYCEKCLARRSLDKGSSCLSPIDSDGNDYYVCHGCGRRMPADILDSRIYDELLRKFKHIKNDPEAFIKNILYSVSKDNIVANEAIENKKCISKQVSQLFESFVNGEILESTYQKKMTEYKEEMIKVENYLKTVRIDAITETDVRNRVNRFLNLFYESEDKIAVIKENVSYSLYDPRNGSVKVILKLEDDFDSDNRLLASLVTPDEIKRSEFDLKSIIIDILQEHPYIKIKEILAYAQKTWTGFTYTSIKKALQHLEHENKVAIEGRSYICDTYHLVGQDEDFDYQGIKMCRAEKEVYKLTWGNQTLGYEDIAKIRDISTARVRDIFRRLRAKHAFDHEHFDKNIIQNGSFQSIYTDSRELTFTDEEFLSFVLENPSIKRRELVEHYGVSEGKIRAALERNNLVKPKRRLWQIKEDNNGISN